MELFLIDTLELNNMTKEKVMNIMKKPKNISTDKSKKVLKSEMILQQPKPELKKELPCKPEMQNWKESKTWNLLP